MLSETLASWQWSSRSNVTSDFNFDNHKVHFVFDVTNNLEKRHYKMESNFEELDAVKIVAVRGASTRALLLQVSSNGFILSQSFST